MYVSFSTILAFIAAIFGVAATLAYTVRPLHILETIARFRERRLGRWVGLNRRKYR
jgi:hypothetical protein